jgi:hypothetical protein
MSGRLYTVANGVHDREAFRSLLARLDIDSHITADGTIALDRAGMEQLAAWFTEHEDTVQAAAIRRALDA